ncbi:MAG: hypothetical protein F4234_02205 [Gammaproteobacteria bacterium]|nr:hypothetical protein [Gammaproteobacteria bacterium]MXY89642.1 hypothetical protein [Gammaproteobacteria bacterium]MYE98994.1 hypothetical protein [Gammaproteobacteria bacterium]MYG95288.1 hypothetical protein [Gammaproteobacteria bacterium]
MKTSNRKVSRLLGILNYDGPSKTLKEMEEAVARGALQRYARQFHALTPELGKRKTLQQSNWKSRVDYWSFD